MILNLRTKGFTLIELIIVLIVVSGIGYFVFTHWFTDERPPGTELAPLEGMVPQNVPAPILQPQQARAIGEVKLLPDRREEEAASEEVVLPKGVKVTKIRERTLKRTINIQWKALGEIDLSAGLMNLVDTSLKGEISRIQGQDFQESETFTGKVELDGNINNRYNLVWIDTWRTGNFELLGAGSENEKRLIPFEYREKTKLVVEEIK